MFGGFFMNFLFKVMTGEFNFIIPISYMAMATIVATFVFILRYTVYKVRKRHYFSKSSDAFIHKVEKQEKVLESVEDKS
jgi:hypothetical protein